MNPEDEALKQRILYLLEVEKLSGRRIIRDLGIGYQRLARLLRNSSLQKRGPKPKGFMEPFLELVRQWYKDYPHLLAKQVFERLKDHGFTGSLSSIERATRVFRKPKTIQLFRELSFLPAEEAQVDWLLAKVENIGSVSCFLYRLSYSRFSFGKFYPKASFEFFLDGHMEAFKRIKGLPRAHRYDNLKSVVLKRYLDRIDYNGQFLDFSRRFGFKIILCNVRRANEKGRVERLGLDVRRFLYGESFKNLEDLNQRFWRWLERGNAQIHRITGKAPMELLVEEKLLPLPSIAYPACRLVPVSISKTAMVEFETNRYSAPSIHAGKKATLLAFPEKIEIKLYSGIIATHKRSFDKHKAFQNPLHEECLLNLSPRFKAQRIYRLICGMEPLFDEFVRLQEEEPAMLLASYTIFKLLKTHGRLMVLSAIRELLSSGCVKPKALESLLNPFSGAVDMATVNPKDSSLLNIRYEERSLSDYDPAS